VTHSEKEAKNKFAFVFVSEEAYNYAACVFILIHGSPTLHLLVVPLGKFRQIEVPS
jgi:hypothetical protein